MKVSTRGRYAIRVMIDLAKNDTGECIPLSDIAKRQGISEKYLEAIVALLVKAGHLSATRGKKGGYRLKKAPEDYSLKDILETTEGAFAPVSCLETTPNTCERADTCPTLSMWTGFQKVVNDYFENISLAELLDDSACPNDYSI